MPKEPRANQGVSKEWWLLLNLNEIHSARLWLSQDDVPFLKGKLVVDKPPVNCQMLI